MIKQVFICFILMMTVSGVLCGDTLSGSVIEINSGGDIETNSGGDIETNSGRDIIINDNDFSALAFSVIPGVSVPAGTYSDIFKPGSGVTLRLAYNIPYSPFFIRGSGTYNFVPLVIGHNISILTLHADGGMVFQITPQITASPFAGFGYFCSFLNDDLKYYGSHPCGTVGIESTFSFTKTAAIGINAGYRHFFGFYDDLYFSVSGSLSFPGKKESILDLSSPHFSAIFPVLLKYYSDNPVGSIFIHNNSTEPVMLRNVSLFIKKFMKEPRVTAVNRKVKSRENFDVDFFAHFTEDILNMKTEQETKAVISVEYQINGKRKKKKLSYPVTIHPRNMINIYEPEQIAVFVSRDDPVVEKFTKSLKKTIAGHSLSPINTKIFLAISAYNALKIYGITLVDRPVSDKGYKSIQYPGTTLTKKQGDRIDLLVLLCSILESLDVKTALSHTQTGYFLAFSLDSEPEIIKEVYSNIDNLIIVKNSTWIPLAIVSNELDFFKAVEEGAGLWKESKKNNIVVFCPVHDLSELYNEIVITGNQEESDIDPLPEEVLEKQNNDDFSEYFYQKSIPKPRLLESVNEDNQDDISIMNNLAVLYAQYKFYDKALIILTNILLNEEYVPALINTGNIHFLQDEMKKARACFERAYEKDPIHPVILLNLSRVNFALDNYGNAKESFKKLKSIDQELAEQYNYIELNGQDALIQAAKTEKNKKVIWIEE